jgi:hypothetical protein
MCITQPQVTFKVLQALICNYTHSYMFITTNHYIFQPFTRFQFQAAMSYFISWHAFLKCNFLFSNQNMIFSEEKLLINNHICPLRPNKMRTINGLELIFYQ